MKIAYFDCFSGISGDMTVGALIDAGLPLDYLQKELLKLNLKGYKMSAKKVKRAGLSAYKFEISPHRSQPLRQWNLIREIIEKSNFDKEIKEKSLGIFNLLAKAEAKIHGCRLSEVKFHEIGAIDTIIDIVSTVIGLKFLGIQKVYASSLPMGRGYIQCQHGILPNPAPATLEILAGVPLVSQETEEELVTPTGAAIIKYYAEAFGSLPEMVMEKVSYGAGTRERKVPNLLRLIIGQKIDTSYLNLEKLAVLETNIDDMNPELIDYITGKLLSLGALDVWYHQIQMKKNRPGLLLKVLSSTDKIDFLAETIFKETTTFGIRVSKVDRIKLPREIKKVRLKNESIQVKIGYLGGKMVSISPEYEDCRRVAKKTGIPLKQIYEMAKEKAIKTSGVRF